jgi:hypothetical protein
VLRANRRGLDGAGVKVKVSELKESGDDAATAKLTLRWQIPRIGGWGYHAKLRLRRSDEAWRVRWAPATVHPRLDGETRLGTTAVAKPRGEILDRDHRPLERAIRGGGKEQFVDALVLRPPDYRRLKAQIEAVPDAATAEGTAMLAPSRAFARALLGTVAPATKEQLEKLGGRVGPGASVGHGGWRHASSRGSRRSRSGAW